MTQKKNRIIQKIVILCPYLWIPWISAVVCFSTVSFFQVPQRWKKSHSCSIRYSTTTHHLHQDHPPWIHQQDVHQPVQTQRLLQCPEDEMGYIRSILFSSSSSVDQYSKDSLSTHQKELFDTITLIVNARADARHRGDYETADRIRIWLETYFSCSCTDSLSSLDGCTEDDSWNRWNRNMSDSLHPVTEIHNFLDIFTTRNTLHGVKNEQQEEEDQVKLRTWFHILQSNDWPKGYKILLSDIPRKLGGGSTWDVVVCCDTPSQSTSKQKVPIINKSRDIRRLENLRQQQQKVTTNQSVLELAHLALGLATYAARNNMPVDQEEIDRIAELAKNRIRQTGFLELGGRKAADAAFWFALAGVRDNVKTPQRVDSSQHTIPEDDSMDFSLFTALTCICTHELQRFGHRSSCAIKYILHIVERIAAAGIKGPAAQELYQVAAQCILRKKGIVSSTGSAYTPKSMQSLSNIDEEGTGEKRREDEKHIQDLERSGIIQSLRDGTFDLNSPRSLLWIWRFASRQRKQSAFLNTAVKHWNQPQHQVDRNLADVREPSIPCVIGTDIGTVEQSMEWSLLFDDPSLPLVIDCGCGMGVSVLGLSTLSPIDSYKTHQGNSGFPLQIDWTACNFIGIDRSRLAIGYASSIAERWGTFGKTVQFVADDVESMMYRVRSSYPGGIALIMINFPTPFRMNKATDDISSELHQPSSKGVENEVKGNTQLPSSASLGFMVTQDLINVAHAMLSSKPPFPLSRSAKNSRGYLLLQSNCEDVAVYMKNMAVTSGFHLVAFSRNPKDTREPSRIRIPKRTSEWINFGGERAIGEYFSTTNLIPDRGLTETEVSCKEHGTPVHRCLASI